MTYKRRVGTVLTLGLLTCSLAWGDLPIRWEGTPQGWEPEGTYCKLYDPRTVLTIPGVVQKVETVAPLKGMANGVSLLLQTDKGTIPVHLGPTWYVQSKQAHFSPEDAVEVTGSKVPCNGQDIILAATVKKGHKTYKFREQTGFPAWVKPPQETSQK